MGDSGVYFLTIFFSFSLINSYHSEESNIKSVEEIFILLMIPGIDMFRVFIERLRKGKNPFKPDRSHLHHLLLSLYSEKLVLFIYFNMILLPLIINQFKIISVSTIIVMFSILYFITVYKLKSKLNKRTNS
jgi:UDP-GlcNAc:undecaprenyl-phosphate GlcNAc-1-phosphate transferase